VKGIRVKGENCHLPWKEVSEFEDDEFDGFCGDFEQKWSKIRTDLEKGIENEKYVIETFGEDTEEWKEATQKAHDLRENLRVQFELKNSYEELRTQLEEWEEDKQWKAREESNRRATVERNLPTIPEEGEDFENLATQNEMADLTLDSPLEFANLQNIEQAEDRLSLPEQVVIDEDESSGNPELGGEENPSMHEGSEIVPNEFIEFDNNLVKVNQFSEERNEEKDVLVSLALMEEMIVNQCMVKRRKNESLKLIAEGAVLKVKETNKIRELYRILNEIPESYSFLSLSELRLPQSVLNFHSFSSSPYIDSQSFLPLKLVTLKHPFLHFSLLRIDSP
jgi:hypothetical protein